VTDAPESERTQRHGAGSSSSFPFLGGVRTLASFVVRNWLRLYHRLRIDGREHLPLDRSFIMVANHASHLDTLCLLSALPMCRIRRVHVVAARDYFWDRFPRAFFAGLVVHTLPFERQTTPWLSLTPIARLLDIPRNIVILFPEGTRSSTGEPVIFKPGIAMLTAGRDLPVIPCHLAGTHRAWPKGCWLPRPRTVSLTIGRPRNYTHLPANRESAEYICRELRSDVVRLGHSRS
jgi:1-acyl-sn-glycerol-3-phosphate acyltransferase